MTASHGEYLLLKHSSARTYVYYRQRLDRRGSQCVQDRSGTFKEDIVNRPCTSLLADLGPLPEVVESESDSTWELFQQLQSGAASLFADTVPSSAAPLQHAAGVTQAATGVRAALDAARRNNRVCPSGAHWERFYDLLKHTTGLTPPPLPSPSERNALPKLVRRMLLRDQVEWAADLGYVALVVRFFNALPEEQWVHMAA